AVDELAVGDDEEDATDPLAFLGLRLAEDAVVEDGLLDRDRERLLRPEADRVRELLRVGDADDVERPHADPVVRDAEADAAARELVLPEEGLQRLGKRLRVAQLAADDDARVEWLAGELEELRLAVVRDAGGGQAGRADLEADEPLRRLRLRGLRTFRGLRLPRERELLLPERPRLRLGPLLLRLLRRLRLTPEGELLLEQRLLLLLLRERGELGGRNGRMDPGRRLGDRGGRGQGELLAHPVVVRNRGELGGLRRLRLAPQRDLLLPERRRGLRAYGLRRLGLPPEELGELDLLLQVDHLRHRLRCRHQGVRVSRTSV